MNLYVGKQAVKFNIPEGEAVERLTDLIREHGPLGRGTAPNLTWPSRGGLVLFHDPSDRF